MYSAKSIELDELAVLVEEVVTVPVVVEEVVELETPSTSRFIL